VVQRTCYGPKNERFADLEDVSFRLGIPRMILVSIIVFFGLFPNVMLNMIQTASIPFVSGLP
jgi:NADH-quinone oxidoreductase subunit M